MNRQYGLVNFGLCLSLALLGAACGDEEPLDMPSGSPDAGGSRLPSTGSKQGAGGDAGTASDGGIEEDGAADASGEPDAAVDAAGPASHAGDSGGSDAGTGSYCDHAGTHAGCADFDTTDIEDWDWLELSSELGSSLTETQDGVAPGPAVMRAATTGKPEETAMAAFELPAALGEVTLSFDVKLAFGSALNALNIWGKVQQTNGKDYAGVLLGTGGGGSAVAVQNLIGATTTYDQYPLPAMPAGWVHVRLHIVYGMTGSVEVQFGDAPATRIDNIRIASEGVTQTSLGLGLYTQNGLAATALYDNAVVDFTPAP